MKTRPEEPDRSSAEPRPARPRRGGWLLIAAAAVVGAAGVFTLSSQAQSGDESSIDTARTAYQEWVETRREIADANRKWQEKRRTLEERIALVQREIDSVKEETSQAESKLTESGETFDELSAKNDQLKEADALLRRRIAALEARTKKLLDRLPDRERNKVRPFSQQIPEDPQGTNLPITERFKNVIAVLNEANKANNEITVVREMRKLGERSAEVTAVYVGISMGFYVSDDDQYAGRGTAASGAWVWTEANDSAAQVRQCIKIINNDQVAGYIKLPVEIQ